MTDNWSRHQTLILINELRKNECLYKATHPDYKKTNKKRILYDKIAEIFHPNKPDVTGDVIRNKIRTLTKQVPAERRKMLSCMRSGMATADKYLPTLWCFEDLSFLLHANDQMPVAEYCRMD